MSDTVGTSDRTPPGPTVAELARATRFTVVCMALFATAENMAICGKIGKAGNIFADMLGTGSALPAVTVWVLQLSPVINVLAFLLPVVALFLLFTRKVISSIYATGVLLLFTLTMSAIVEHALWTPLHEIIRRMQGGAPGA